MKDQTSGDQNFTKPHVIGKMFYLYTHFHDITTSRNMTFFWYTKKLHEKCNRIEAKRAVELAKMSKELKLLYTFDSPVICVVDDQWDPEGETGSAVAMRHPRRASWVPTGRE